MAHCLSFHSHFEKSNANSLVINRSLLETLHRKKVDTKPQLKIFYIAFCLIFVWEVFPEYIMPLLTAVNIFCLANRNSSRSEPQLLSHDMLTRQCFSHISLGVEMEMRVWDSCPYVSISSTLEAVLFICHFR